MPPALPGDCYHVRGVVRSTYAKLASRWSSKGGKTDINLHEDAEILLDVLIRKAGARLKKDLQKEKQNIIGFIRRYERQE